MFFVSCIVTFLERTRPASNIEKPAAIQNTKKPPIRNRRELRIKTVSVGTATAVSCACADEAIINAPNAGISVLSFIIISFDYHLNSIVACFTGSNANSLIYV